jgi:fructosamine-3-kinase
MRCGTDGRGHFVKRATGTLADALVCEADGLRALAATATIRVPRVVDVQIDAAGGCLVLEWLDLRDDSDGAALGTALARLHRAQPPRGPRGERFGWHRDNWIGGTRQANGFCDDWCTFFRDRRLAPQFALAFDNGYRDELAQDGGRLLSRIGELLHDHAPVPSIVHGDLWSGNAGMLATGEPCVFDPAVYVGDREVDLAMAELFGGFAPGFALAYASAWPLAPGYPLRRDLYNLYHLLNHLNLFGAGYLSRTRATLTRLLAVLE